MLIHFRYFGKSMKKHEAQCHNLLEEIDSIQERESDDVLNYQCNLLNHGLLYANFRDAISEGDGERIIRCWKFLLLHFYADGNSSTKYALEALFLQFQQQALLSPRQAYLQKWNRSVNRHSSLGKNVPFDLDLEHDNNHLKEAMRKLGPNVSESSVSRICGSLKIARETIENISRECQVMKRSGKHFVASMKKDYHKLVENLINNKAFLFSNGRKYKNFTDCERSALHNLNMADMCKWINQHKHEIKIGRTAR